MIRDTWSSDYGVETAPHRHTPLEPNSNSCGHAHMVRTGRPTGRNSARAGAFVSSVDSWMLILWGPRFFFLRFKLFMTPQGTPPYNISAHISAMSGGCSSSALRCGSWSAHQISMPAIGVGIAGTNVLNLRSEEASAAAGATTRPVLAAQPLRHALAQPGIVQGLDSRCSGVRGWSVW